MIYIEINNSTNIGNWMFEYAAARSRTDDVAFYGTFLEWRRKLEPYLGLFTGVKLVESVPDGVSIYHQQGFHYRPLPSFNKQDVVLKGTFQSEKFFDSALIRRQFAIPDPIHRHLLDRYGAWLREPGVTGISVRRGDYLRIPEQHPFIGKGYLKRAVKLFPQGAKFVVCSDDIPWCKGFFRSDDCVFVEGEPPLNQIYVHALCQNNIISNSSFSWWGAWLNAHEDKRLIAPKRWFGMDYRDADTRDLLPLSTEYVDNHLSCDLYLKACFNETCRIAHRKLPWLYRVYVDCKRK